MPDRARTARRPLGSRARAAASPGPESGRGGAQDAPTTMATKSAGMTPGGCASRSDAGPMTRRVGAFTHLPSLIRQVGGDPAAIFAEAGLEPSVLDAPANRVPYDALLRTLQLASEHTSCAHFGLFAGASWQLADLGALGEIVRHSPSVEVALLDLVLHQHVNADGTLAFMLHRGAVVDLGYAAYATFPAATRHIYDAALAVGTNILRQLCGPHWNPAMVMLQHSAPADVGPHHRFFKAPVHFDAEFSALRFHESTLQHAITGSDAVARASAEAQLGAAGPAAFGDAARRALRTLLIVGRASGGDVARSLAVHRRTLDRRLAVDGLTFQQVLDEVRLSLARELLQDSGLTISSVASALGFHDQTAFFRAFRRWTGTTPGRFRDTLLTSPDPVRDPVGVRETVPPPDGGQFG
jgi:AraC-like DNA-binding protein